MITIVMCNGDELDIPAGTLKPESLKVIGFRYYLYRMIDKRYTSDSLR